MNPVTALSAGAREGLDGNGVADPLTVVSPKSAILTEKSIEDLTRESEQSGSWSHRFWGLAKSAGGALEAAVGTAAGAATGWTGFGAIAGGAVALHGTDTTVAGLREVITGVEADTLTEFALEQ